MGHTVETRITKSIATTSVHSREYNLPCLLFLVVLASIHSLHFSFLGQMLVLYLLYVALNSKRDVKNSQPHWLKRLQTLILISLIIFK